MHATLDEYGGRHYSSLIGWSALIGSAYLPVTAAPIGRTANGLPIGVQIVAPYLHDRTALAFARCLADVLGGYEPPPLAEPDPSEFRSDNRAERDDSSEFVCGLGRSRNFGAGIAHGAIVAPNFGCQAAARVLRRIGSTRPSVLSAAHMTLPAAPGVVLSTRLPMTASVMLAIASVADRRGAGPA